VKSVTYKERSERGSEESVRVFNPSKQLFLIPPGGI